MRASSLCCGLLAAFALTATLLAGARDKEWESVREACDKDQPRTAAALLGPLEAAAFADHAWGEGTKALVMRVRLENGLRFKTDPFQRENCKPSPPPAWMKPQPVPDPLFTPPRTTTDDPFVSPAGPNENTTPEPDTDAGSPTPAEPAPPKEETSSPDPFAGPSDEETAAADLLGCVRQIDREWPRLPAEIRPVLRWFQAAWLDEYRWQHSSGIGSRQSAVLPVDAPMETWDVAHFEAAIQQFRDQALAEMGTSASTPARDWSAMFRPGTLDDSLRPTLHDLLAHLILEGLEESIGCRYETPTPDHDSPLRTDSPLFGPVEAFLAWHPDLSKSTSMLDRMLPVYQNLLAFHRDDADRSALLHCDLERLRWAGMVAAGSNKEAIHSAAIRTFIAAYPTHPLSADARQDDAILHLRADHPQQAHAILLEGAAAFPNHPFGKFCGDFARHLEKKELEISTPDAWSARGDIVSVRQKNLAHLWFRIYPTDWNPAGVVVRKGPRMPRNVAQLAAWIKDRKPTRAWDAALANPPDFRSHQQEIPTPADLPAGVYLLITSGAADALSPADGLVWNWITVADFGITSDPTATDEKHIAGRVMDLVSGNPLAGVPVEGWQPPHGGGPALHWETLTDSDGGFRFEPQPLPHPEKDRASVLVVAKHGGQRILHWLTVKERPWYASIEKSTAPEANRQVTMFTDRAVYRPGQTIQFKGIVTETHEEKPSYATVAGAKVAVSLVGPNSKECGKLEFTTNGFGSFSGSFPAPEKGMLGNYSLRIGERDEQRVRVEEYKRQKFTVELNQPDQAVIIGKPLEVKGRAVSYTDAPIGGATVAWTVHRSTGFSGGTGWRTQGATGDLELMPFRNGTTTTAPDGTFSVSFIAEADDVFEPALEPVSRYYLRATVTDPTGEQHEDVICTFAAAVNLAATLEFPEWMEAEKPVNLRIHTLTLNHQPLPAKAVLRVHRLQQPADCPREFESPFDQQDDQLYSELPPPACWPTGEVVKEIPLETERTPDGKDCLATCSLCLPGGIYRIVIEAAGDPPRKVLAIEDVYVEDPRADHLPMKRPCHIAFPKQSCEPGETISLLWGSGLPAARACVEWLMDDKLLKREWSAPGRTQQVFSFTPDESMRGGIHCRVSQCGTNRYFFSEDPFEVPWSNKELKLDWQHLTSKLQPGAKDTWTATVRGPDGKPAAAEMVATLYDASLDHMMPDTPAGKYFGSIPAHSFPTANWTSQFRSAASHHSYTSISASFDTGNHEAFVETPDTADDDTFRDDWCVLRRPYRTLLQGLVENHDPLNGIAISRWSRCWVKGKVRHNAWLELRPYRFHEPPNLPSDTDVLMSQAYQASTRSATAATNELHRRTLDSLHARRDLRETAFFLPDLTSAPDGTVRMSFTMPEGLGKWKFLGFAHDTAMRFGTLDGETITAKDLMVQPNPPRFLREGDVLDFPIRLFNQSDAEQSGLARFTIADDSGEHDLTAKLGIANSEQPVRSPASQSQTLNWRHTVPEGTGPLRYKALATCGAFSDGEEGCLPVLPRRIAVTDSLALRMRDAGEKHFEFSSLRDSGKSETLRHQSLRVEVISNPAWQVLLALPYLMEFPHECAEQTFHRYFAAAIARRLLESNPQITKVLESWRNSPTADSPLERNQDLTGITLEETPWLRDALNDSQARHRLAGFFDGAKLAAQEEQLKDRLEKMQKKDGLWPWFAGGPESEATTLCIVTGFGRLRTMGVESDLYRLWQTVLALDHRLTTRFRLLRQQAVNDPGAMERNHLDPWIARHLYARSFFLKDWKPTPADLEARNYFLEQARRYWPKLESRMAKAHVALALWRDGDAATAKLVTRSLRERAIRTADDGMFWRDSFADGWWWWQAPIETQTMMIEAFSEIDQDPQAVDDCRTWLIQQKRSQAWPTTIATADAVFAVLSGPQNHGENPDDRLPNGSPLRVTLGGTSAEPANVEAGTGFYQHRFGAAEVKPAMGDIVLSKSNRGVAWANVHWQYFEDLGKLASHETKALRLEKSLFVRHSGAAGTLLEPVIGPLRVGDELVTRLVVSNDRAMEFVHVKDSRASGTEPVELLSGYHWQDGLAFYRETRDAATHIFLDSLPPGTHVFEIAARIQHAGIYQSGSAEIRCLYAPGFSARSNSVAIEVE